MNSSHHYLNYFVILPFPNFNPKFNTNVTCYTCHLQLDSCNYLGCRRRLQMMCSHHLFIVTELCADLSLRASSGVTKWCDTKSEPSCTVTPEIATALCIEYRGKLLCLSFYCQCAILLLVLTDSFTCFITLNHADPSVGAV